MKIKIDSDIYDISSRVKDIDDGYFIVYDDVKKKYELHNSNQLSTYCLTYPYENLDCRLINLIYYSSVVNIDNIISDIDKYNESIDKNNKNMRKDYADYMLREIYKYYSNSSKELDNSKAFSINWR